MRNGLGRLLLAILVWLGASLGQCVLAQVSTSYSYDALGRVTGGTYPGGASATYAYDAAGNRTLQSSTAQAPAPVANTDSVSIPYGGNLTFQPKANDTGAGLVIIAASQPAQGRSAFDDNNIWVGETGGFYGTESFQYTIRDALGRTAVGTVNLTVAAPAAPTAANGAMSVAYESNNNAFDLPVSGIVSSAAGIAQPSHGWLVLTGLTAHYTPYPGYYGADSFIYTATGPGGTSASAIVTVTVGNPPAPVAGAGAMSVAYESNNNTFDLPVSGVVTSAAGIAQPSHGWLVLAGLTAHYTPYPGYYGADSFTYTATGPGGTSAPATINVTVGNPPAPTGGNLSASTAYNTPVAVTATPSGVISNMPTLTGPSHGALSGSNLTWTYTPAANFYGGSDSWTYRVDGPGGSSPIYTVTVNVSAPPAPGAAATSLSLLSMSSGSAALLPSGVYDGVSISAQPSHGSVSLSGTTATYTPSGTYVGADSFSYVATGPGGGSAPSSVNVTVQNRAPTANADTATVTPGVINTISPLANDTDPEGQTLTITAASASDGAITYSAITLSYTPPSGGIAGSHRILNYTITDGYGGVASSTVDVTLDYGGGDGECTINPRTGACELNSKAGGPDTSRAGQSSVTK